MDWTDLYNTGILISRAAGPFLAALWGGLVLFALKPYLKRWLKAQRKRLKNRERMLEELFEDLEDSQPDEIRQEARIKLRRIMSKRTIVSSIPLMLIVLTFMLPFKVAEEVESEAWKERFSLVRNITRAKTLLHFRTIVSPDRLGSSGSHDSVTKRLNEQLNHTAEVTGESKFKAISDEQATAIRYSESICKSRAYVESEGTNSSDVRRIIVASSTYRACMLEEGWLIEECGAGEQDCIELLYLETTCALMLREWLVQGGDDSDLQHCTQFETKDVTSTLLDSSRAA